MLENHHKNGYNADHFYHFKLQLLGECQRPKFRVNPAPEVDDFAMRCMNFSSHFEHLICHMGQTFVRNATLNHKGEV